MIAEIEKMLAAYCVGGAGVANDSDILGKLVAAITIRATIDVALDICDSCPNAANLIIETLFLTDEADHDILGAMRAAIKDRL